MAEAAALEVLAARIATGLGPAMPTGVELSAKGPAVHIAYGEERVCTGLIYADEYPRDEALRFAAEMALDDLQDRLAHLTTDPWPTDRGGKIGSPFVEIRGSELVWGYGSAREPIVELPRFALHPL
jgi:hypothetical protein